MIREGADVCAMCQVFEKHGKTCIYCADCCAQAGYETIIGLFGRVWSRFWHVRRMHKAAIQQMKEILRHEN